MKFVIKSLLFVNLLLQMTSSLRKCFNQDQNLMLTIILLAFSLIGIIGLTVGNRFILIIFAACMTLILIASITIYAIGRTEQDASKPKVPYYTQVQQLDLTDRLRGNRMKSFASKAPFNRTEQTEPKSKKARKQQSNRSRPPSGDSESGPTTRGNHLATAKRMPSPVPVSNQALEDYSDEPTGVVHLLLAAQSELPFARSGSPVGLHDDHDSDIRPQPAAKQPVETLVGGKSPEDLASNEEPDELNPPVQSQQWVAYERHLYERYLAMVSQSIDLILLSILASWMALLLDEDSDQCFGNGGPDSRAGGKARSGKHEAPMYNYNGVRYSIKPDGAEAESPSRVLVR